MQTFDKKTRNRDNPPVVLTLDSKRHLIIPAALVPASPGERFDAEEEAVVLRHTGKEDWLTVLKECPVSMDDVPPRRREMARCHEVSVVALPRLTKLQD